MIFDTPDPGKISIYIVESLLVSWINGIEGSVRESSVGKLGDSSAYKAVMIEWQGAIRHGLNPESKVRTRLISRDAVTNTWCSGRVIFMLCGRSFSWTLLNNQSLAANPPTRTTCLNASSIQRDTMEEKKYRRTDIGLWAILHWSNTALTIHSIEASKNVATSDPRSLSWPNRILKFGSLSLAPPNLIYWGSSEFRNLSFVLLSKQLTMWSRSAKNVESCR